MPGKRVQFDGETWLALDVLARDRMMSFQELADEAFRDLLDKYHRPTDLKAALKQSAGTHADVGDAKEDQESGLRRVARQDLRPRNETGVSARRASQEKSPKRS
jgi:hypothetical protein